MSKGWLKRWWDKYDLFSTYTAALIRRWQDFLWGESILAAAMLVYIAVFQPPVGVTVAYFVFVMLLAGYFAWRADHIRLIPKFTVTEIIAHRAETETGGYALYVQIIPECLTDAPVYECRGHLLRVSRRVLDTDEWEETGMNFPLFLGWDCYGIEPFTLEPGVKRRLNVCWWRAEQMFIVPSVQPVPSQFKSVFNSLGTFKFDIRLTAKDCSPVDVSVTVNLDERIWNQPKLNLMQTS